LTEVDGSEVRRALDERGAFELDIDGEIVSLNRDELEVRAEEHEDLTLAQDGPHAVALDLTVDDELRAEGLAREVIRAVNDRRKADGFALADRVQVVLRAPERIAAAARRHGEWIAAEVLATRFDVDATEVADSDATTTIDTDLVAITLQ
jgi:isoleucyl-tRNA synthetase